MVSRLVNRITVLEMSSMDVARNAFVSYLQFPIQVCFLADHVFVSLRNVHV